MKTKVLHENGERTIVLVFETGDRVIEGLLDFARTHALTAGHFTAIGAFQDVTLGYFDWENRDELVQPPGYLTRRFDKDSGLALIRL